MRRGFLVLLCAAAVATVGVVQVQRRSPGAQAACDVCERAMCKGTSYTLRLSLGRAKHACCPRCGIRFEREHPGAVRGAWVKDFAGGRDVRPRDAVYVEGSDFSHCQVGRIAHDQGGGLYTLCFDRCTPSLVAFADPQKALEFERVHGGALRTFDELWRE